VSDYIKINELDNVLVALVPIDKGTKISTKDGEIEILNDIPMGHKIAIKNIKEGEDVIKYGYPIGAATGDIAIGEHIHVHNLKTKLGDNLEYDYSPKESENVKTPNRELTDYFYGYERFNKKVGVRNNIWIIPTVGCVNDNAKAIANACQDLVSDCVDSVVAFSHPYGCSQMGEDQENSRIALTNLMTHPNAGGVLVLGLGCENSNINVLKEYLKEYDESRIRFLVCQDVEDEIEEGISLVKELAERCGKDKRTKQPISKLVIGLKCGGSDGLSGITANPTIGVLSDYVTGLGGTTILTEVPEMFGAETILMNRATDRTVFEKTVSLINDFKNYFKAANQTIYENPSPGNKAGGISTLEDKALGCTQKSGMARVVDVLPYGGRVQKKGLNLLCSPGNDLVAATALSIADAQIVLFSTGRGTPFASPVPTVKISTNSALAAKKKNWIDFDCGILVNSDITLDEMGSRLFDFVLDTANGKKVKSELSGFCDLAIFKQGVTL